MFSHRFCDHPQTDTRKVIDGKPRVFGVVHWEYLRKVGHQRRLLEAFRQLFQPHRLAHFLHQDFDKDTTTRRRIFLVHLDN